MADRLTILSLKILHGAEKGKDTKHFLDERNALLTTLRSREITGAWLEFLLELSTTNAALWYAEDELRDLRRDYDQRASGIDITAREVAFRIQALNDRRAELVQAINQATGDFIGPEKC